MRINLTTQTEILTITNEDLDKDYGYLYKYFYKELEKEQDKTVIKTLAYNENINTLVLLIFDKDNGFTQKIITLEEYDQVRIR